MIEHSQGRTIRSGRIRRLHAWKGFLLTLAVASPAVAQSGAGDPRTLQTGLGLSLQTALVSFPALEANSGARLQFEFGFSTAEKVVANTFQDSFTVSLESAGGLQSFIVTGDASGASWAPATPGGLTLDSAAIQRSSLDFPSLPSTPGPGTAYSVSLPIPPQFVAQPLTVRFDLFDNQDSLGSLAYYRSVEMVPEPEVALLMAVASGLWLVGRRRR